MSLLRVREELILAGRTLLEAGLVNAQAGNLSARVRDSIVITKTGTNLGELNLDSFVVGSIPSNHKPQEASSEFGLHYQIYNHTKSVCVLHAHAPHLVALSLSFSAGEKIHPSDTEAESYFDSIFVVEAPPGSEELAFKVAEASAEYAVVLARAHGVFVHSTKGVPHAVNVLFAAEYSARVLLWSMRT